MIVTGKDKLALLCLQLGYRDLKTSSVDEVMADNYRTTLYCMRLYKYAQSAKRLKQSRRYALLAYVYAHLPDAEQVKLVRMDYDEFSKKISVLAPPSDKERLLLALKDCYYKWNGEKSYFDTVWERPDIEQLDDYKKYKNSITE